MRKRKMMADNAVGTYRADVVTGCWWLPPHVQALTFSRTLIFTRAKLPSSLVLAHELVHIQQMRTINWFRMKYIWEFIWHGKGWHNKYEREAYEHQQDIADHTNIMVY